MTAKNWIFIDDDFNVASAVSTTYNQNTQEVISQTTYSYSRITEQDFIDGIKQGYVDFNVQPDTSTYGGFGIVPMQTECLGTSCATEEDWCTLDPNCSESPYQEPDGKVKGSVVGGFTAMGAVIVIGILCVAFFIQLKKQQERIQRQFAQRVAETIDFHPSGDLVLTPEALRKEFEGIDDNSDGTLSKDELWTFMTSGKAGTMDKKDFEVMFKALDVDNNGTIDFLEFCTFLTACGKERDTALATSAVEEPLITTTGGEP